MAVAISDIGNWSAKGQKTLTVEELRLFKQSNIEKQENKRGSEDSLICYIQPIITSDYSGPSLLRHPQPSAIFQAPDKSRIPAAQIISLSTLSFNDLIWPDRSLASFVVILAAMTARLTPQALPKAVLLGTYT